MSAVSRSRHAGWVVRARAAREADLIAGSGAVGGTRPLGMPEPRPDDNNLAA